jgi:hypothetical protein
MSAVEVIYDMPEVDYLALERLSSSGMKTIVQQSPAHFAEEQSRPVTKPSYDFGSVWHQSIFPGQPLEIEVVQKLTVQKERVDADTYDGTKSAAEDTARIRESGKTPILRKELTVIEAMVEAAQAHPEMSAKVDPRNGFSEVTILWNDERTGLPLKARLDWLPANVPDGQPFEVIDGKTAASAEPYAWLRKAADYGLNVQDAVYRQAVTVAGLHHRPDLVFLVQEKSRPYPVTFVRLAARTRVIGEHLMAKAIDTYIRCEKTGRWPAYTDDVFTEDFAPWYLNRFEGVA